MALLDTIVIFVLGRARSCSFPVWLKKAELARIGRYYASESMLVLGPGEGRVTTLPRRPLTGNETLSDFYARLIRGEVSAERGDHSVLLTTCSEFSARREHRKRDTQRPR